MAGRAGAWATLILMATSPFAITYATSTRMYSMMVLWSLLGLFALVGALEDASLPRLAFLGGLTAVMVSTHYWALDLIAGTAPLLPVPARRALLAVRGSGVRSRRSAVRGRRRPRGPAVPCRPWRRR